MRIGDAGVLLLVAAIPSHAQTFTTIATFDETNGCRPYGVSLVQGTNGNFYGTTSAGGANGYGVVFEVTPAGSITTLYSFPEYTGDGIGFWPSAGLTLAANATFYGTTSQGGYYRGGGTVFAISQEGSFSTLYDFSTVSPSGDDPLAALVQANNGELYGTTFSSTNANGGSGNGTVFKVSTEGKLDTLDEFDLATNPADGGNLYGGLVQATNGRLYGVTSTGGGTDGGTIFEMSPSGHLTTIYSNFAGPNGLNPVAALVQASNGDLYGTTEAGGTGTACDGGGCGTIFKTTVDGKLTTLHEFTLAEGWAPVAPLIQTRDGNLYGMASMGGEAGYGTIFKMTPAGKLTVLHSFLTHGDPGYYPYGGLVHGTDGNFYGVTSSSHAAEGCGTIFQLSTGLSPFVKLLPKSAKAGATVTALGTDLAGATGVSIDGHPVDSFTVNATGTAISFAVPPGASGGAVAVTTPHGTLSSDVPLQVIP